MRKRLFCLLIGLAVLGNWLPAAASELYFQALVMAKEGNDQAAALMATAAEGDLPMADHASYYLIQQLYPYGDQQEILSRSKDHLKRFPYSRFSPEVELIYAESLCESGDFDLAFKQMESFRKRWLELDQARALTIEGMALAGLKRGLEAQQRLAEAAHIYSYQKWSRRAKEVAKEVEDAGLGSKMAPAKSKLAMEIEAAFKRRHFITCQRLCNTYVRLYPGGDSWRYRLKAVDCLVERRKRRDARRLLESVSKNIPNKKEAQAALLLRWARAERGRDFKGRPQTNYWKIAEEYPKTEAGLLARYYIGYLQFDSYDFASAVKWLDPFVEKWKKPHPLDEALWYAGFSHFLEGNGKKAIELFSRFENEFPDHKDLDRSIYWRGRAYEQLKETEKARQDYHWLESHFFGTYYGLAAQLRLETLGEGGASIHEQLTEKVPWEHLLPILPLPRLEKHWAQEVGGGPELDQGATAALEEISTHGDIRIRRIVRNFLAAYRAGELDLAEESARFLHDNRMDVPYAGYVASIMFALCNENLMSIIAANDTARVIRKGELFDSHRLNARRQFPLLFTDVVETAAERYQLDPWLVLSLVKQESAFQIVATSHVGARGLFQVMPATGRWIARKRGIKGFSTKDLYDPETSADFGTWYFKRLLDNNDQDVVKALTGYNAGGARANRWWAANPNRYYDEMIELLGFHETQMYVKIILRNWEMYQRLYLDPHTKGIERPPVLTILLEQIPEP